MSTAARLRDEVGALAVGLTCVGVAVLAVIARTENPRTVIVYCTLGAIVAAVLNRGDSAADLKPSNRPTNTRLEHTSITVARQLLLCAGVAASIVFAAFVVDPLAGLPFGGFTLGWALGEYALLMRIFVAERTTHSQIYVTRTRRFSNDAQSERIFSIDDRRSGRM